MTYPREYFIVDFFDKIIKSRTRGFMSDAILYQKPACLSRHPPDLFIKRTLYQSCLPIIPIYINKELFNELFHLDISWQEMADFIITHFNISLDQQQSNGLPIGWAYIDKQADPLGLALSGNAGSGRAYYAGQYFNIKGEKTPLATSNNDFYTTGILKIEDAIHSTIAANAYIDEIETGLSPVLAILDLDEYANININNSVTRVKKAKIIRIDKDGCLDRISHLFVQPEPLSKQQIMEIASALGKMEAEKMIHRFLHGAWSVGNVSPKGHIIDFDTVCAVKGRQPQYCMSKYHSENYFGFEYKGQIKVMECILNNKIINNEQVLPECAIKLLMDTLQETVAKKLVYLMGFSDYETIYTDFQNELFTLAEMFFYLSRLTRYKTDKSFFVDYPFHLIAHVFDFSAFFRIYPLLNMYQQFSTQKALSILAQMDLTIDENGYDTNYYENEALQPSVYDTLKEFIIQDDNDLNKANHAAISFIKAYDNLYNSITAKYNKDPKKTALQAYIVNEDRFYLLSLFDLTKQISKSDWKPEQKNNLINLLIYACKRNLTPIRDDLYATDIRIYKNAITYLLVNEQGTFHVVYEIEEDWHPKDAKASDYFIQFKDKNYPVISLTENKKLILLTERISMANLLIDYHRNETFDICKHELYFKEQKVDLINYYCSHENSQNNYLKVMF